MLEETRHTGHYSRSDDKLRLKITKTSRGNWEYMFSFGTEVLTNEVTEVSKNEIVNSSPDLKKGCFCLRLLC
jgi:hypothetical protein